MTKIEKSSVEDRARELMNAVWQERNTTPHWSLRYTRRNSSDIEAVCRALEAADRAEAERDSQYDENVSLIPRIAALEEENAELRKDLQEHQEACRYHESRATAAHTELAALQKQFDDFRQEVSEAVLDHSRDNSGLTKSEQERFSRFILPAADPFAEVMTEWLGSETMDDESYSNLRAALARRGIELTVKGEGK